MHVSSKRGAKFEKKSGAIETEVVSALALYLDHREEPVCSVGLKLTKMSAHVSMR